ncbi:MAG: DUF3987 domain-containing protein [Lachnospiraceae bacterium]|nr:DUF3987 domain-containing protein [Lachnospiraceae bacterium]
MAETERMINGITFTTTEEYLQAKKELAGIAYVKENNDMSNDQTVLALYNKFVQKDVFHTQIGYEFLKGLQERLMRSAEIDKSQVAKLPIRDFSEDERDEKEDFYVKQEKNSTEKKSAEKKVKQAASKVSPKKKSAKPETKKKPLMYLEAEHAPKRESELDIVKSKYKWSVFFNVLLVIVIIIMAYITLNSDHVNILNYETKLQDKYASWAQELQEQEEALNKLRNELKVNLPD